MSETTHSTHLGLLMCHVRHNYQIVPGVFILNEFFIFIKSFLQSSFQEMDFSHDYSLLLLSLLPHMSPSALYVVDLKKFRKIAAGDRLRGQYQALSQDPNSLSNLDQVQN